MADVATCIRVLRRAGDHRSPSATRTRIRRVAQFSDLARPVLLSISTVSADTYGDIDETELRKELKQRGIEPGRQALVNVMHALKDAGYIDCTFTGGGIVLIRLQHAGRQEVEGWPIAPGVPSSADIAALLDVLEARSEDVELSQADRGKARAAAGAVRDLGVSVTAEVIGAWLKHLGVG